MILKYSVISLEMMFMIIFTMKNIGLLGSSVDTILVAMTYTLMYTVKINHNRSDSEKRVTILE